MPKKRPAQPGLFASEPALPALPEGFKYAPDFLSAEEERELVQHLAALPFEGFEFHGFVGKRRVVSFGWRYDFNQGIPAMDRLRYSITFRNLRPQAPRGSLEGR